tara:strand:+ start:16256 stop:17011 length:756 start_codon:yes stop_codon:yes gene_type:complete
MSNFGKNIRKIRSVKTLSQQAFAELFDLKRGTLGAYEEGRSEPKIETIIKIANYFSIPIDDLLTKELTVNSLLKFKGNLTLEHDAVKRESFASVPCITDSNFADYITHSHKEHFVVDLPNLMLPVNPEKQFRGYTVQNLEMSTNDQGLFPKDIAIGEYIPPSVYKKLNNGILVLILTSEALILRRLFMTNKSIVLRADHKNVDDIEMNLKDVKEMWRIRYVFYHRLPDNRQNIEEKLERLEQEFAKLKDNL